MKSLVESLFDDDLVNQGIKVEFDELKNKFLDFKNSVTPICNRAGWNIVKNGGDQTWYFQKFYHGSPTISYRIIFDFGILKVRSADDEGYDACIAYPLLKCIMFDADQMPLSSYSDWRFIHEEIIKKIKPKKDDPSLYALYVDSNSLFDYLKLFKNMIKIICSKWFDDRIQKEIKTLDGQNIPNATLERIFKDVIKKA